MLLFGRLLLAAACLATVSARAVAQDPAAVVAAMEERLVTLIERVEPSVVSIVRGRSSPDRLAAGRLNPFGIAPARPGAPWNDVLQFPHPGDPNFVPDQFGAGVVLADSTGRPFILTNQHVVQGGPAAGDAAAAEGSGVRIYVRFRDGRGYYAPIHAADPRSDLAVLRIDFEALGIPSARGPEDFPRSLPLSQENDFRKGQFALVFGNPYGVGRDGSPSVGWGMVGNVLRRPAPVATPNDQESRRDETIHHYGTLLQIDSRADLGFSGGATVDRDGKLIGITTSLAAIEGYESTTGFAIPLDAGLRRIVDDLLKGHEAEYGFLGVQPADITAAQLHLIAPSIAQGRGAVRAESVKKGSPADRGGLEVGDIVLSIDRRPVHTTAELMRQIGLAGPDANVELEVLRSSSDRRSVQRRVLTMTLDKWPVVNDRDLIATVPRYEPWHGLHVDHATARERFVAPQLEPYPQGVVVLASDQPLGNDPIKAGDIITAVGDRAVNSPYEFYTAVESAEPVTLRLADGRRIQIP
jgi:serine protease Do